MDIHIQLSNASDKSQIPPDKDRHESTIQLLITLRIRVSLNVYVTYVPMIER